MVLKDSCTDTLEELPLGTRDQAPDKLDELIEERQNDLRFAQSGYKMFSCFHLDQAGEFMGAAMQAILKKHGINEIHFKDPARKEDAGPAEIAVQQIEIQVKKCEFSKWVFRYLSRHSVASCGSIKAETMPSQPPDSSNKR